MQMELTELIHVIGERQVHFVIDDEHLGSHRIRTGQRIDFVECGFGPLVNGALMRAAVVTVKCLQQIHTTATPLQVRCVLLGHRKILHDRRLSVFHLNNWRGLSDVIRVICIVINRLHNNNKSGDPECAAIHAGRTVRAKRKN